MAPLIAVGMSDDGDIKAAFREVAQTVAEGLAGERCDLCVVFASGAHLAAGEELMEELEGSLAPATLIGCGASGVLAAGREIEDGSAVVVWGMAAGTGAEIEGISVLTEPVEEGTALIGLPEDPADYGEAMIVLADPRSFSSDALLTHLNEARPGMPVLGAHVSAAPPGGGSLFLDGEVIDGGAVVCCLRGVPMVPCVSQGAEPVGPEMTVTAGEGNVIRELASKPALERLREAIVELDAGERAMASDGMLLGFVIDENRPDYLRGDFLVRPIVGADPGNGEITVGDRVRVGQIVRMQVRDADSADQDLREALAAQVSALGESGAAGALLFTCNGRGTRMFPGPDHDARAFDEALGVPVGGFFSGGEIGPVGGRSFIHGFTATMAVFPRE